MQPLFDEVLKRIAKLEEYRVAKIFLFVRNSHYMKEFLQQNGFNDTELWNKKYYGVIPITVQRFEKTILRLILNSRDKCQR